MQTKRLSAEDPISLEGFEALLDRVFEPHTSSSQRPLLVRLEQDNAPYLVASDPARVIPATTAPEPPVTSDRLKADVRLLAARLEYAFEALAQSRFREKVLRATVASMEDQLKLMPDLLSKMVRLNELEDYLRCLATRLSNLT